MERIVGELWNSKKAMTSDRALLREQARTLMKATTNGYGKVIDNVAWDSPDFAMLSNLTKNVYQFSAAKNYQELRDFTSALVDGNRVRSFAEFKDACLSINGKYNGSWLQTEYNQAIACGQAAGRWAEFEADKKTSPYLKYQSVGDANVRDEHKKLDGTVRKIDDAFWNTYYVPNGWGCRCEVIQLPGMQHTETNLDGVELPVVPKLWRINVGKQGVVFPPESAYYNNIPTDIFNGLEKDVRKVIIQTIKRESSRLLQIEVKHEQFNTPITFTNTSFDEYLNQPHKNYMEKNFSLYKIDDILKTSTYLGELKPKNTSVDYSSHLFESVGNNDITLRIIIKKYVNGRAVLYSTSDSDRILDFIK